MGKGTGFYYSVVFSCYRIRKEKRRKEGRKGGMKGGRQSEPQSLLRGATLWSTWLSSCPFDQRGSQFGLNGSSSP